MTKTELLNWLSSQDFCDAIIGEPQAIGDPQADGTQWYAVTIREVYESTAITRRIHFYVVNENTSDETAYWKDSEPTATLAPQEYAAPAYKMITFRTIMDAIGAEMYMSLRTKLDIAAAENVLIRDVVRWLETVGPDAGIDINSENTQTQIQGMVSLGVITQSEADAVIALADNVTK